MPHEFNTALVYMPKFVFLDYLKLIKEQGAKRMILTPSIAARICKDPIVKDFLPMPSVEAVSAGGAAFSKQIMDEIKERLGVAKVGQGYALTESSGRATLGAVNNVSVGRIDPGVHMKIVSVDGPKAVLDVDQPGELHLRGKCVMLGYANNPTATAEAIDLHGYLRTGDLAYVSADGEIYITGRMKMIIKVFGMQVTLMRL